MTGEAGLRRKSQMSFQVHLGSFRFWPGRFSEVGAVGQSSRLAEGRAVG